MRRFGNVCKRDAWVLGSSIWEDVVLLRVAIVLLRVTCDLCCSRREQRVRSAQLYAVPLTFAIE